MIEYLDAIDKQWLLSLNAMHSSFWDGFMYTFSGKFVWVPLYLSILFLVIKRWKKESWWLVLALILSIVFADQIASGIIKTSVMRFRPTHSPEISEFVNLVKGYRGGKYGFVSSHAANSFALALLSTLFFRNKLFSFSIFLWAIVNSYSRIYLGVHYPGDILGGTLVGIVVAIFLYFLLKKIRPTLFDKNQQSDKFDYFPSYILWFSIVGIAIYAVWFF